jgi:hypothetical protein
MSARRATAGPAPNPARRPRRCRPTPRRTAIAERGNGVGRNGGSAVLAERELRMSVQVTAQLDELALDRGRVLEQAGHQVRFWVTCPANVPDLQNK